MLYTRKTFTVPVRGTSKNNQVTCEACVFGEKFSGPHTCAKGPAKVANPDQDIHCVAAANALGIKPEQVTAEQRNAAKAVNHALRFSGGPQLAPDQSVKEFCDLYGKFA